MKYVKPVLLRFEHKQEHNYFVLLCSGCSCESTLEKCLRKSNKYSFQHSSHTKSGASSPAPGGPLSCSLTPTAPKPTKQGLQSLDALETVTYVVGANLCRTLGLLEQDIYHNSTVHQSIKLLHHSS